MGCGKYGPQQFADGLRKIWTLFGIQFANRLRKIWTLFGIQFANRLRKIWTLFGIQFSNGLRKIWTSFGKQFASRFAENMVYPGLWQIAADAQEKSIITLYGCADRQKG